MSSAPELKLKWKMELESELQLELELSYGCLREREREGERGSLARVPLEAGARFVAFCMHFTQSVAYF